MNNTPGAQKLHESKSRTEWRVTLDDGRRYLVQTYPDSSLMYVENERRRAVNIGQHTAAEVRTLIANAQAAT